MRDKAVFPHCCFAGEGTSAICDAVDVRFGLEYTHYRRPEEKSEHKEEQEVSEELKAAKKPDPQRASVSDSRLLNPRTCL